jgi:hypothetical protein
MQIIKFEFILYANDLIVVLDYSLDENKFEVCSLTSLTFSGAIYQLLGIHIGYTLELIESHFPIRPVGSDHSFVSYESFN